MFIDGDTKEPSVSINMPSMASSNPNSPCTILSNAKSPTKPNQRPSSFSSIRTPTPRIFPSLDVIVAPTPIHVRIDDSTEPGRRSSASSISSKGRSSTSEEDTNSYSRRSRSSGSIKSNSRRSDKRSSTNHNSSSTVNSKQRRSRSSTSRSARSSEEQLLRTPERVGAVNEQQQQRESASNSQITIPPENGPALELLPETVPETAKQKLQKMLLVLFSIVIVVVVSILFTNFSSKKV